MTEFLKGNFKVKNAPSVKSQTVKSEKSLNEKFKKKAIENIGGSMVFVERDKMTWEPKGD